MYLPKKLVVSFCCLLFSLCSAANTDPDSLNARFSTLVDKNDTIGIAYFLDDFEERVTGKLISPADAGLLYQKLARSSANQYPQIAKGLIAQSDHYAGAAGDSAIVFDNKVIWAQLLMNEDDRARAIVILDEVLRKYISVGDSSKILETTRLLANNYDYLGDHTSALEYYEQCTALAEKLNNLETLSRVYGNIAGVLCEEGDYKRSIETYEKALPIAIASGNPNSLFNIYQGLGIVYQDVELFEEAYSNLKKCYQVSLENHDIKLEGFALQSFGYYFLGLNKLDSAEHYMNRTKELASKINNAQLYFNALEVLQEVYYKTGRYQEAYNLYVELDQGEDSIYTLQNTRLIESIKARYETERKERELAEKNLLLADAEYSLKWRSQIQNGLILLIVLLMIITFLIYRGYRLRKRANDLLRTRTVEAETYTRHIEAVNETKSRWFINVAHELRTPLTLIKGPVKRMIEKGGLHGEAMDDLKMVEKNADHLVEIVNEILDLSKLEDGAVPLDAASCNIKNLITEILAAFDSTAGHLGVAMENGIREETYLKVDHGKIRKLFINLISNALKHTTHGCEITIGIIIAGEVKISVKDNGTGIKPADLPYIFDRFYQSTENQRGLQGGTGVGLALSKEIAELHGGTIIAESVLGKGSVFTVILPKDLMVEAAEAAEKGDKLVVGPHETNILEKISEKPQLLLVEDNSDMRRFVASLLKDDFQVIESKNGFEALQQLTEKRIKLIISDVMMPEMDGVSFLKEVKANSEWERLPFIHLSALADHQVKQDAFRIGIDDYLQKPFDPNELKVRVRNLYHNYKIRIGEEDEEVVSYDEKIIKRLREEVLNNLDDSNFAVWRLADCAAMSERKIYRFLRKTTGLTPHQFIQEIKLARAMEMIEKHVYSTVSEVSNAVGFPKAAYFSSVFEKRFGKKPISLMKPR